MFPLEAIAMPHLLKLMSTEKGKPAIACAGPVTWNGLPIELRKAQSLDSFQQKLKTLLISQQYITSH